MWYGDGAERTGRLQGQSRSWNARDATVAAAASSVLASGPQDAGLLDTLLKQVLCACIKAGWH